MAEKKRGGADNSDFHKSKKKMQLDLDDPVIDCFSDAGSALFKKREEGDVDQTLMSFKCATAHSSSCLAPCRNEAAVKTATCTLRENLEKEHQEMIKCVASEIGAMWDASQLKHEKERQKLSKELTRKSKECESSLKGECEKLRATCEKFREELATHGKAFNDISSKFEAEKKLMSKRNEQQSEKYRIAMSETDKECLAKITAVKDYMRKEKPGQEAFQRFADYLRSLVEDAADEEDVADRIE